MQNLNPDRRIAEGGITTEGQIVGFTEGVDSFSHPMFLKPTQFRWGENIDLAGGIPQARPGYKTRFTFDMTPGTDYQLWWLAAGKPVIHPQMLKSFQPTGRQLPQLVFAVSGSIWYCEVGFDGTLGPATRITQFNFNANADQLVGCPCVQSGTIISGLYANNIQPRNLLVIQDGLNRAGLWDGTSAQIANPLKKVSQTDAGDTLFTNGYNETRVGKWMAWSGNRLWVADGVNVYASDLKDPTHFTEEMVANSAQSFTFPEPVTGMIDRGTSGTTRSQLFVFTNNSTWTLWSGLQNRIPSVYGAGWAYTADFMAEIFKAVGCAAGKSLVLHRGLLYWRGNDGIVLFDSTGTVNSTQNLPTIDQEVTRSSLFMSPDASQCCSAQNGSKVLFSVPVGPVINGRPYNGHTQVLDRQTAVVRSVGINGPFSFNTTGWAGVWTGIRPVEWANVSLATNEDPVYALSMDQDGVVRIWEAFQGNRSDNGLQIPWLVETRSHVMDKNIFDFSNLRHFRILLQQIIGNVSVVGSWRGTRGKYHELLTATVTSTPGSILTPLPDFTGIINTTEQQNFLPQSRTLTSRDNRDTVVCSTRGVESQYDDGRDHAFSLLLQFRGHAAMTAYRIAADAVPDNTEGVGEDPSGVSEDGFNIMPGADCPEHIDGVTPPYVLADQPRGFCNVPLLPTYGIGSLYQSPVSP